LRESSRIALEFLHKYSRLTPNGKRIYQTKAIKNDLRFLDILSLLKSIPNVADLSIREIAWCIKNEYNQVPTCATCGNEIQFKLETSNKNHPEGYIKKFCNLKCFNNNIEKNQEVVLKLKPQKEVALAKRKKTVTEKYGSWEQRAGKDNFKNHSETLKNNPELMSLRTQTIKRTCMLRYGVEHASQTKTFQENITKTYQAKYGVNRYTQTEEFKKKAAQTNLERYGNKFYQRTERNKLQVKRTNLLKYGVECPLQRPEVRERIKRTNLLKHGVEYPWQSPEIREQAKRTNLLKYGVEHPWAAPEIRGRTKRTNLLKYGYEHPWAAPEVREQIKRTNLERYGYENPSQALGVRERIKRTNLERYGTEYPTQATEVQERAKRTNLLKYGVEHPMLSPEIQERIKNASLLKYGVEHPMLAPEVRERIKSTNLLKYGTEYPSQALGKIVSQLPAEGKTEYLKENYLDEKNQVNTRKLCKDTGCNKLYPTQLFKKLNIDFKPRRGNSMAEDKLMEYISFLEYGIQIDRNRRDIIKPFELDIYLPDYNLAIEYNGLLWHSSGSGSSSISNRKIASTQHLAKTKLCLTEGIELIHVFEDEYLRDPNLIETLIARKLNKLPWPLFYLQEVHWPIHHGEPTHLLEMGYKIVKIKQPRANYFNISQPTKVSKWTIYSTEEEAFANDCRVYHDCGMYVLKI